MAIVLFLIIIWMKKEYFLTLHKFKIFCHVKKIPAYYCCSPFWQLGFC